MFVLNAIDTHLHRKSLYARYLFCWISPTPYVYKQNAMHSKRPGYLTVDKNRVLSPSRNLNLARSGYSNQRNSTYALFKLITIRVVLPYNRNKNQFVLIVLIKWYSRGETFLQFHSVASVALVVSGIRISFKARMAVCDICTTTLT